MVRDYSTSGGHLPGDEVLEGARKTVTKKWQGYPPENLNVLGKPMPALPEVSVPEVHRQSAIRAAESGFRICCTSSFSPARIRTRASRTSILPQRRRCRAFDTSLTYKNAPKPKGPAPAGLRDMPDALPEELNLQGEAVASLRPRRKILPRTRPPRSKWSTKSCPSHPRSKIRWRPTRRSARRKRQPFAASPIRPPSSRTPPGRRSKATSKKDSPKPM